VSATRVVAAQVHPIVTRRATGTISSHLLIRLDTDDGVTGWGEVSDLDCYRATMPDVAAVGEAVTRVAVGHDPTALVALHERMSSFFPDYRYCARTYPPFTLESQLAAGIELACFDITGKRLGVPVSDLLGGRVRDEIEIAYPIFTVTDADDAQRAHELVRSHRRDGRSTFRYYVGTDLAASRSFLHELAAGGDGVVVKALDFQGRLPWKEVLRFVRSLEDATTILSIGLVESAAQHEDYEGMATLRRAIDLDVVEHASSTAQLLRMIGAGAVDAVNVGVQSGGILPAKRLFDLADAAGLGCLLGTTQELSIATAAGAHLAAVVPGLTHPSDPVGPLLYLDDVTAAPVVYDGSRMVVPTGPGLGIDVDESLVERLAGDLVEWDRPAHGAHYVSR